MFMKMSSSKESNSSGSEGPYVSSIKSLPDFYETPGGIRSRRSSVPASHISDNSSLYFRPNPRPLSVTYKTQRTTTGLFKKKTTVVDYGSYIKEDGEIQAATGEWIHDYLNRGLRKNKNGNARLFVPFTAEVKKNIKRSWTISNPSGTTGPQLQPRTLTNSVGDPELRSYAKNDANVPTPKIAPPVFLSVAPQVPPSLNRPSGLRRNVPIRSQSMSQADANRFYLSPQPHLRHLAGQKPVEIQEVFESDEDFEDEGVVSDGKVSKVRRHYIHHNNQIFVEDLDRKYKTLDPKTRILTEHSNPVNSYNSLERSTSRRKLPNVPNPYQVSSHSLPRPSKQKQWREQSDSRSRDRNAEQKRSRSHENELSSCSNQNNRRQLPNVPENSTRDIREPTPDYDATSLSSLRQPPDGRRNSDPAIHLHEGGNDDKKQIRRFFGTNGSPNNNQDSDEKSTKALVHDHSSTSLSSNFSTDINIAQISKNDKTETGNESLEMCLGQTSLNNTTSCNSSPIGSSLSGSSTTPDFLDLKISENDKIKIKGRLYNTSNPKIILQQWNSIENVGVLKSSSSHGILHSRGKREFYSKNHKNFQDTQIHQNGWSSNENPELSLNLKRHMLTSFSSPPASISSSSYDSSSLNPSESLKSASKVRAIDLLPPNIRPEDLRLDLSSLTKSDYSDATTASDLRSFEVTSAENSNFF